jgi:hypothetical protein
MMYFAGRGAETVCDASAGGATTKALDMRAAMIRLALVAVVVGTLTTVAPAATRAAGLMGVNVCRDLVTGQPAPASGWAPSEHALAPFHWAEPCEGSNGWVMSVGLGAQVEHAQGDEAAMLFDAPANTTIAGFSLWRQDEAGLSREYGTPQAQIYEDATIVENCNRFVGCERRGSSASPVGSTVSRSGLSAHSLRVDVECGGERAMCPASETWMRIYGGEITLADVTTPEVSGVGGGLISSGTIAGKADIDYKASDAGTGVYQGVLYVDGKETASQVPNTNGGRCEALHTEQDGAKVFNYVVPCPPSVSGHLDLNTNDLADGVHTAELVVESAAGVQSVGWEGQIRTDNGPVVEERPTVSGVPQVGSTLTASNGLFEPRPEQELVEVKGQWERCVSESSCGAIPGASGTSYVPTPADVGHELVYESTAVSKVTDTVAPGLRHTTTASSIPTLAVTEAAGSPGSCAGPCTGPPGGGTGGAGGSGGAGASAGSGGAGAGSSSGSAVTVNLATLGLAPAKSGELGTTKPWRISLKVRPRRVHRHTRIRLFGHVFTAPRPAQGKLVFLQARDLRTVRKRVHGRMRRLRRYGRWITFMALRAKPGGAFVATYRFRLGGRHTYAFRAVAPSEGGFRNPTGTSVPVVVHER